MKQGIIILFVATLMGCAQQSSPSGGDKDTTPPEVLLYEPAIFQTNFEGSKFEMVFDEYVQVQDLSSQLIISPPLANLPEYKIRGTKVEIAWEDSLSPNTTYQFNFGKAIVDLNEGNVNPNLNYVFSTGDFIDSLSIYGNVFSADDNAPLSKAAVMIYTSLEDSMPTTTPPDYFALSDERGNFNINYLPANKYKVFVLHEENNNYIYDGPPERIAFMSQAVESSANDSSGALNFMAFIENDTSQYIASAKGRDYGRYDVIFNVPTTDAKIQFKDTETDEPFEARSFLNSRKDSLLNWVLLPQDHIVEEVTVITQDGNFVDTAYWYLESDLKYREKAKLQISSNTTRSKLNLTHEFTLRMNNPLVEADTALVYFLEDSVQVFPTDFERSGLNRKFIVRYPFKASASYVFKADIGAFKDIFGAYSDSIAIPFSLQDDTYYGSMQVDISLDEKTRGFSDQKILQVYTEKNALVTEVPFSDNIKTAFHHLEPGKYLLKVVYDTNGDGKWTTGSYVDKTQAERISIYPEEIQIRSNWDLEVEWQPAMPF